MAICSPNSQIKWSDVSGLGERIDDLAKELSTPNYEPLKDDEKIPFKFDDVVDFDGVIRFELAPGTIMVRSQYLGSSLGSTAHYNADPVLLKMAASADLKLVIEKDDCWCTTVFNVFKSGSKLFLEETQSPLSCCQTLTVPQQGDALDYSQHVIPAGFAAAYATSGNPGRTQWLEKQACHKGGAVSYHFAGSNPGDPITHAARQVKGFFTWPMRKKYMDAMVKRFRHILKCSNSGGAERKKIRIYNPSDPSVEEYLPSGCEVTFCGLVADGKARGVISEFDPGCIWEGCCTASDCNNTDADKMPLLPWEESTCGGLKCEDKGWKFYCKTLIHFDELVKTAENGLRKRKEPDEICRPCDCVFVIDCEVENGFAAWCVEQFRGQWVTAYTLVIPYEEEPGDGPGACEERNRVLVSQNIVDCNSPPFSCQNDVTEDRRCMDDTEHRYEPLLTYSYVVIDATASVPWSAMYARAKACSKMPTEPPPGFAIGSTRCRSSIELVADGYATVSVNRALYRVRLEGMWNCSSDRPDSIILNMIRTERDFDPNEPTRTTKFQETLTWNEEEQTYTSKWEPVKYPSEAGLSAVSNYGAESYVEITFDPDKKTFCPGDCYKLG